MKIGTVGQTKKQFFVKVRHPVSNDGQQQCNGQLHSNTSPQYFPSP